MKISSLLEHSFPAVHPDLALLCFDELDSTSGYLKHQARDALRSTLCIAERQTAGYGQQQREWHSISDSLTFSLLLPLPVPLSELDGFTQLVALKVVESLQEFSEDRFQIKWPNDLYLHDRKCGGILVECVNYSATECWLVIGIGLNVTTQQNQDDKLLEGGEFKASALRFNEPSPSCASDFVIDVTTRLRELTEAFHSGLFASFCVNYQLVDYFAEDCDVIVYDNAHSYRGRYQGVNAKGEAQVLIEGQLHHYRSGSVSIRRLEF